MTKLHAIFCKVDANSNKLFVLLELHSSFRFQYRLLTMTTLFEIALYVAHKPTHLLSHCRFLTSAIYHFFPVFFDCISTLYVCVYACVCVGVRVLSGVFQPNFIYF